MANPKSSAVSKKIVAQAQGANTVPTIDSPPKPATIHTLPDVAGDDQSNVVSVAQQLNGLGLTIPIWQNAAEFPGEFDSLRVAIDSNEAFFQEVEGPITGDVDIIVKSGRLRSHGPKIITYSVTLSGLPNGEFSLPQSIFVDAIDPNGNNRPGAPNLPADLPAEGVTPAYLAMHGGVTLTLARPVDSRPGDTGTVFFGDNDDTGTTFTVPPTGPITVTFTAAQITLAGQGDFLIYIQFTDRAGNATQVSIPRTLSVRLTDPPGLSAPTIPVAEPLVVKNEAREGVLVSVLPITNAQPNDWVHVFWNGIEFGSQRLGVTPVYPLEFHAQYDTIAAAGPLYTATVNYLLRRGTDDFPSPDATVNVDLVEPGTPIVGPGPVDTTLALPVVMGDSAVPNSLIATDLDGVIHARFTIYADRTTAPGTEFIDLWFGPAGGMLAGTYALTGAEADGFVVPMTIPRAVVENYGNGTWPCWYRVRNANNYKQSQMQDVTVNIFSLTGLADPQFTDLFTPPAPSTEPPFISCEQSPWINVPVRIFDPATLKDNDTVVIHAIRYAYTGPVQPADPVAGTEVNSTPIGIGPSERVNGFTYNFVLPYFDGDVTRRRGWLEISWSIVRSGPPPESGTSDPVVVKWDIRSSAATGTCAPITLRGGPLV